MVHGFLELWKLKSGGRVLWISVMLAVFGVGVLLLIDLIVDILRDPMVTSMTISNSFDEPIMFIQPITVDYNTDPILPEILAERRGEILSLASLHRDSNKNKDETSFTYCPKPNVWFGPEGPIVSAEIDLTSDDIMSEIEKVRSALQAAVIEAELTNTDRLMWPPSYINASQRSETVVKEAMCESDWLWTLSSDEMFVNKLIKLLDIIHIDDIQDDIPGFYQKILPEHLKQKDVLTFSYEKTEETQWRYREYETSFSGTGIAFKFNLSVVNTKKRVGSKWYGDEAGVSANTDISYSCNPFDRMVWDVGSKYKVPDLRSSIPIECSHITRITLKLVQKTYHGRYCSESIKTTCLTDCLIQEARKEKSCLPYLGVPNERRDLPFCQFDSGYHKVAKNAVPRCDEECDGKKSVWHPCSETQVESYVVESNQYHEGRRSLDIFVHIGLANGLQVYHTEPKYTVSNILGAAGGILGICFGISIMSVMQIIYHCFGVCNGKEDLEE